jgi:electron transfer flavoprotein alpha/beta subunit
MAPADPQDSYVLREIEVGRTGSVHVLRTFQNCLYICHLDLQFVSTVELMAKKPSLYSSLRKVGEQRANYCNTSLDD